MQIEQNPAVPEESELIQADRQATQNQVTEASNNCLQSSQEKCILPKGMFAPGYR